MSLTGNWNYPTRVRFGAGRLAEVPDACAALGVTRPLIVTDPGLAQLPPLSRLKAVLGQAGMPFALFSALKPNPVGADVVAGIRCYLEAGCDGVVAIGGGSALDVGKAVALLARQLPFAAGAGEVDDLWQYEDVGDNWARVDAALASPVLALPTTAGTGSEVGRASVIVDEAEHRKVILFHPLMLPGQVIADPELTVGLPPALTAATGIDALVHNFEAYCAAGYHPLADGIALEGMRLVHGYLERAVRDGQDIEARAQMLAASLMGATAFQKGLGAVHALAHPVGAVFDKHHGLVNAVLLPYVIRHQLSAIEEKLSHLARVLGLPGGDAAAVLAWVEGLRAACAIPDTLAEIGVGEARADEIARMAKADPSDATNPRPWSVDDYRAVFLAACRGESGG